MLHWQEAWQSALYGPEGFYRQAPGPSGHFRTASHAAPEALAGAIARLAGEHGRTRIVDVGAGRGELANALVSAGADSLDVHAVDLVPRPASLDPRVTWWQALPTVPDGVLAGALVIAWELLDNVPMPILQADADGALRAVLVSPSGRENLGNAATAEQAEWSNTWWPGPWEAGYRVEVGQTRDAFWHSLIARIAASGRPSLPRPPAATDPTVLLAVDYAHTRAHRPAAGTLIGYQHGRLVNPTPDGTCDITAHVALDAVAAAGERAGAQTLTLTDQRTALRALGLTGRFHPREMLNAAALQRVSGEAELIDSSGLGAFGWLLQQI